MTEDQFPEPVHFEDSWSHPNIMSRKGCKSAIKKEIDHMEKRDVWDIMDEIPVENKPIGIKWVFKKKTVTCWGGGCPPFLNNLFLRDRKKLDLGKICPGKKLSLKVGKMLLHWAQKLTV